MTRDKQTTFEVEIRDTEPHDSEVAGEDADVTILGDSHHNQEDGNTATDSRFKLYDNFVVYVEDDHDEAFDVAVQSVAYNDDDYSGATGEGTVNLAAGADSGRVRIDGSAGRIRFQTTAPSAAPTGGSLRITVQALGRARR